MNLVASCLQCGVRDRISVWPKEWNKYAAGELVQNVWPSLEPNQRDIIHGAATGAYLCEPCNDRHAE